MIFQISRNFQIGASTLKFENSWKFLNFNLFLNSEEIDPFDMITGDDISRLPDVVNPNEKKPETIEEVAEEKPSYAAVARSRPTSECNDNELVEDPVVEDVVEEPGINIT